jgi:hypothetical protein
MKKEILFTLAIGLIAYGFYKSIKNKNKKAIGGYSQFKPLNAPGDFEIWEDNFDSTWEIYGCRYNGYKK